MRVVDSVSTSRTLRPRPRAVAASEPRRTRRSRPRPASREGLRREHVQRPEDDYLLVPLVCPALLTSVDLPDHDDEVGLLDDEVGPGRSWYSAVFRPVVGDPAVVAVVAETRQDSSVPM
jgi:hypothetical protein